MLRHYAKQFRNMLHRSYGTIWRRFVTPAMPNTDKTWVHIGPGDIDDPRFINVDSRPLKHIHLVTNEPTLIDFGGSSVDLIYACHVVEHFSHTILAQVFKSWYRVLRTGGTIRLSVPDFDKIIDRYHQAGDDALSIRDPLMGTQDYDDNYHYSVFNARYLESLLIQAGFVDVRSWAPQELDIEWPQDWSYRLDISLNLEASKP